MPLHTAAPVQKRKELVFEDDDDDLMDALGLGSSPGRDVKQCKNAEEEEVRPARAKLEELLGRGSVDRMLEEPGLGERQEVKLAKEFQKQPAAPEEATTKSNPVEEEDWLSAALSQKKAQVQAKAQERSAKPSEAPGEGLKPQSPVSRPAASPGARPQAAAVQDEAANTDSSRPLPPWLRTTTQASTQPSEAAQGDPSRDASAPVPTALFPREQETQDAAPLAQAESPAQGLLCERRLGASTAQPHKDATGCQAALLRAQARVAELESQVRTLELARAQDKLLLEVLWRRHQEDLDLLESTHRRQLKVLEETYRQREQRLRQENEQLVAQLLSQRQEAEQDWAELEQLRELQRVSAQELRREREQRLQQLKCLKDQEVEAVTSSTSHTRTLNGAMDLMEKLSSKLHDMVQKVEATQQMAFQDLATRAQIEENQLKVLEDRLSLQQKEAKENRCRLQEAVAKLEARLDEQTRLLEQERQRVFAERSRAELLEEEQQVLNQQLSAEQAELERMKVRWGGDLQVLFTGPVSLSGAALQCVVEEGAGCWAAASFLCLLNPTPSCVVNRLQTNLLAHSRNGVRFQLRSASGGSPGRGESRRGGSGSPGRDEARLRNSRAVSTVRTLGRVPFGVRRCFVVVGMRGQNWGQRARVRVQESVDDLLDDLLGYEDDESPVTFTRSFRPARGSSGRARGTSSVANQKSHVVEDFFNRFLADDLEGAEGSRVSSGEPQGLLQSLTDLDDLEADVLGASRAGSEPGKTTVKVLEDRLSLQQKEAKENRCRLQEAVAKLEARLDEQTRLLEQERQRVFAERSRAELLEEEQQVLNQQLSAEQAELERMKERAELQIQVRMLRAREEQLERNKELLDKTWQELKAERKNVNGAALRVQQQEEEMRSMTEVSFQKYKEGQQALQEAQRVESQHESRLQALQQHLDRVRQQEECLHQDRLSMAQQRSQLQQLRQELSNSPMMVQTPGRNSSAPLTGSSSVPGFPPAIGSPGGIQQLLARASSTEFSACHRGDNEVPIPSGQLLLRKRTALLAVPEENSLQSCFSGKLKGWHPHVMSRGWLSK
ncbi:fas-binding factor 1 [Athene cunicularia]|uniref:fas-binding factor 1 n=1 Tax=Athene cunicularia TaxID=194338 RepID=UPI000EF738DB|nr:fas-binding factor 1 [Athene cunicularia]